MRQISEGIYGLLVSQGLANAKPVGAGKVRGMKGPGAASDGALGGVAATDREGGQSQSPIGRQGGGWQPMRNLGKGRAVNAPAKFTGLQLVSSRCLDTAIPTREPRAVVSKHLMLVVSN